MERLAIINRTDGRLSANDWQWLKVAELTLKSRHGPK